MNEQIVWLSGFGVHVTAWKLIGLVGALMFGTRWVVQFIAALDVLKRAALALYRAKHDGRNRVVAAAA